MSTIYISGFLIDGVTQFSYELRPNEIQTTIKNIGEDIKGLDGTNHRFHRNYKREFKLKFTNVASGVKNQLQTIFTNPTQFNFQNADGNKYTVFTEADSFDYTLAATAVSLRGIELFTVSIGVCEV